MRCPMPMPLSGHNTGRRFNNCVRSHLLQTPGPENHSKTRSRSPSETRASGHEDFQSKLLGLELESQRPAKNTRALPAVGQLVQRIELQVLFGHSLLPVTVRGEQVIEVGVLNHLASRQVVPVLIDCSTCIEQVCDVERYPDLRVL